MSEGLDEIIATISGMEQRKAALLQELEILDQKLFKVPLACPIWCAITADVCTPAFSS